MPQHEKVIIIGSGPAGYTAAIYTARALLNPLLVSGYQVGGQLTITTDVENYPGFADPISGPWLVEQMHKQAENVGARILQDFIINVDLSKKPFQITCDSGKQLTCDSLIIATGAEAKWLGLESEKVFQGGGVSACATCDGFFFKDRKVAVIGGGNSAVEEALYLANIASHVTLIHRRDKLRAEKILQERVLKHPKISLVWNAEVEEICGDSTLPKVTHILLKNRETGEKKEVSVDGVFVAIGHQPATALFENQLEFHPGGYIVTQPNGTATNVPGVFAAGDVADMVYRQAVTAAGMGCMAALEVEKYLLNLE